MTALNFKWEYKKINFLRLRRIQPVIPRSCFAEDGLEMYKVLKYKCTAVVRLINSFFGGVLIAVVCFVCLRTLINIGESFASSLIFLLGRIGGLYAHAAWGF